MPLARLTQCHYASAHPGQVPSAFGRGRAPPAHQSLTVHNMSSFWHAKPDTFHTVTIGTIGTTGTIGTIFVSRCPLTVTHTTQHSKRHDREHFVVPQKSPCSRNLNMRHQRACFIGANSCPPRPLGTSWPSRNGAYLHAQPDLTMCWTTHNPRTARTRPPRLVTACPSCACPSRVRQAGMSTMGTRTDWIRHANVSHPPRV